jgi:hypothetical protein
MKTTTPRRTLALSLSLVFWACGGGQKQVVATEPPPPPPEDPAYKVPPPDGGIPATQPSDSVVVPPQPASTAPVTFELKNDGPGDLVFALDKGWQPVLFAFSGKPPKAKAVMLFPTWCTDSCDAAPDAVCPVCKIPEKKKEEAEETKREIAKPGGVVKVEWDGQVYAYEKAKGTKKKCKCWRKSAPPAETYTVKACGLRPSNKIGQGSKPVCAEGTITLPLAEGAAPQTITLSFAP